MKLLSSLEGVAIGLIGRPVLWLLKQLRWMFLLFGAAFNTLVAYNPTTGQEVTARTFVPLVGRGVGIILFSVGAAVRRYDELVATFYKLHPISPGDH